MITRLTLANRRIYPGVQPGHIRELFSETEDFYAIRKDYDEKFAPEIMHWRHPGVGFSWTAQPALVELENNKMDWMSRALNLPKQLLFSESNGKIGGCTQSSASDSIFNCILAARYTALKLLDCYSMSNSKTIQDPSTYI